MIMLKRCLMICVIVLLAGCTNDERILDKIGYVQSTSQDLLPDGRLKISASVPIANPEIKETSEFLVTEALSSKEGRMKLARQTNLKLVSGQLRVVLLGEALAKKGIMENLDSYSRDPTVSETVKIVIVEGDAADLLGKNYKSLPRNGQYIDRLITKESRGHSIVHSTLYSFNRDYYEAGKDPVAPIIVSEEDRIATNGIALFKKDKYVDKLTSDEGLIFSFLYGSFKGGELTVHLTEESSKKIAVFLNSLKSKRKLDVVHQSNGKITVNLDIEVKAAVIDYPGELELDDPGELRRFESLVSAELTNRGEKIIKKLQEVGVDSLGIGTKVRNTMSFKEWKDMNWEDEYPKVDINCSLKLKVKDYGFKHL